MSDVDDAEAGAPAGDFKKPANTVVILVRDGKPGRFIPAKDATSKSRGRFCAEVAASKPQPADGNIPTTTQLMTVRTEAKKVGEAIEKQLADDKVFAAAVILENMISGFRFWAHRRVQAEEARRDAATAAAMTVLTTELITSAVGTQFDNMKDAMGSIASSLDDPTFKSKTAAERAHVLDAHISVVTGTTMQLEVHLKLVYLAMQRRVKEQDPEAYALLQISRSRRYNRATDASRSTHDTYFLGDLISAAVRDGGFSEEESVRLLTSFASEEAGTYERMMNVAFQLRAIVIGGKSALVAGVFIVGDHACVRVVTKQDESARLEALMSAQPQLFTEVAGVSLSLRSPDVKAVDIVLGRDVKQPVAVSTVAVLLGFLDTQADARSVDVLTVGQLRLAAETLRASRDPGEDDDDSARYRGKRAKPSRHPKLAVLRPTAAAATDPRTVLLDTAYGGPGWALAEADVTAYVEGVRHHIDGAAPGTNGLYSLTDDGVSPILKHMATKGPCRNSATVLRLIYVAAATAGLSVPTWPVFFASVMTGRHLAAMNLSNVPGNGFESDSKHPGLTHATFRRLYELNQLAAAAATTFVDDSTKRHAPPFPAADSIYAFSLHAAAGHWEDLAANDDLTTCCQNAGNAPFDFEQSTGLDFVMAVLDSDAPCATTVAQLTVLVCAMIGLSTTVTHAATSNENPASASFNLVTICTEADDGSEPRPPTAPTVEVFHSSFAHVAVGGVDGEVFVGPVALVPASHVDIEGNVCAHFTNIPVTRTSVTSLAQTGSHMHATLDYLLGLDSPAPLPARLDSGKLDGAAVRRFPGVRLDAFVGVQLPLRKSTCNVQLVLRPNDQPWCPSTIGEDPPTAQHGQNHTDPRFAVACYGVFPLLCLFPSRGRQILRQNPFWYVTLVLTPSNLKQAVMNARLASDSGDEHLTPSDLLGDERHRQMSDTVRNLAEITPLVAYDGSGIEPAPVGHKIDVSIARTVATWRSSRRPCSGGGGSSSARGGGSPSDMPAKDLVKQLGMAIRRVADLYTFATDQARWIGELIERFRVHTLAEGLAEEAAARVDGKTSAAVEGIKRQAEVLVGLSASDMNNLFSNPGGGGRDAILKAMTALRHALAADLEERDPPSHDPDAAGASPEDDGVEFLRSVYSAERPLLSARPAAEFGRPSKRNKKRAFPKTASQSGCDDVSAVIARRDKEEHTSLVDLCLQDAKADVDKLWLSNPKDLKRQALAFMKTLGAASGSETDDATVKAFAAHALSQFKPSHVSRFDLLKVDQSAAKADDIKEAGTS